MTEKQNHHGGMDDANPSSRANSGHRFGRMFPTQGHEMLLKLSTCKTLGDRMTSVAERSREDSKIPSGYTYFGQFVDHDLSMDTTPPAAPPSDDDSPLQPIPDEDLIQGRSPQLDLDSLYTDRQKDLKVSIFDGPRFKIGRTTPVQTDGPINTDRALSYDLPRVFNGEVSLRPAGKALIGDGRNDENLAVAQTHLMWLKFHNAVVDQLATKHRCLSEQTLFCMSKELVVKHYQYVVLHDFLKRFIDAAVFEKVIVNAQRRFLTHCPGEIPFMPLEFSVAAYRYGHSQVREMYNWNAIFADAEKAHFSLLFLFTELSGGPNAMAGNPTLPTNWIADFRRLYDFKGINLPHLPGQPPAINVAKKIDPYLSPVLSDLPELRPLVSEGKLPFANLAALNLRRGSLRGLPSGQTLAGIAEIQLLAPEQIEEFLEDDATFIEVLKDLGMLGHTPLWLYLLLESAIQGEGNRLGELGSTIVAETFLTVIMTSKISILCPCSPPWEPKMAAEELRSPKPLTSIPEILKWIDDREPIINPLEDDRLQQNGSD